MLPTRVGWRFVMAATGIGHGLYFAVDLALVTDVLPDRERDAAKNLGILNITNALPQSVAPAPSRSPARSPSCR